MGKDIRVLAIGDVVGSIGCGAVSAHLPALKRLHGADIVIVNGENSADGNGIHQKSAGQLFDAGADVITGGNHTLRRADFYEMLEENPFLLRPANYPAAVPGRGICLVDRGRYRVAVVNLMGVVYMESLASPFETADALIEEAKSLGANAIVMDIHAEATAEKLALAHYLDGKLSAVFGTHTHVQTADAQILPEGTGYITDLGMTGPSRSVLGIDPKLAIQKQKDKLPVRFACPDTPAVLSGCLFTVDLQSGRATAVKRIQIED